MENNLLSVWSTVGSVLLAILILLIMITVHEFGHYLVGKLLKFKIDEFSIGFGPAIFKKKRKKSDEIFAIRLIPLGGYCAFAGEDEIEEERKKKKRKKKDGDTMSEEEASDLMSGPFDELLNEPKRELEDTVLILTPPTGEATPAPRDIKHGEEERPPEKKPACDDGLFTHKKPWQRILVLLAGAFMNYILALFFIGALFAGYGQSMIRIGSVEADPAYGETFEAGDILLSAGGKTIYLTTDLADAVRGKPDGYLLEFCVARRMEDGSMRKFSRLVSLRAGVDAEGNKREKVEVGNSASFAQVLRAIGVGTVQHEDGKMYFDYDTVQYRFGFFETVGHTFMYSFKIAGTIFRVIGELFTGRIGINTLGGPVTTIATTSEVVSTSGFKGFLEMAAFIGVNLAVFNLLPIPALDGSKIVFTAIEWIRKKPISRKVEAVIHLVGIVLLFAFAILVDILQFV